MGIKVDRIGTELKLNLSSQLFNLEWISTITFLLKYRTANYIISTYSKTMSVSTSYSTVLLVVHLAILWGVHGQHTYWVASNTSQCGGRTPCQTLDSYARDNASLFSTSHTRWVFLQGEHSFDGIIDIEHAINITLTGEYPCSSTMREQCSSVLSLNKILHGKPLFIVHNATEFVIMNLRFKDFQFLTNILDFLVGNSISTISLHHVHNLTIQASIIDTTLEIIKPSGLLYISQVTAGHLWMDITNPLTPPHSAECEIQPDTCKQFWVNVTIVNSTFEFASYLDNHITITDTMEDSHIVRSVQCPNSSYAITVHFSHCVFSRSAQPLYLHFHTKTPCTQVKFSNCDFLDFGWTTVLVIELKGPHRVEVENTRFIDNEGPDTIAIEYAVDDHHNTDKDIKFIPTIIINNCTFVNNTVSNSVIRTISQTRKSGYQHICIHLAFQGHNVINNVHNYHDDPLFVMAYSRLDFIIALNNVMVGVSGVLEIENNEIDLAAMTVSPNSKILLHNNSQLRIANNGDPSTTAQLLVYYSGDTFQQFLEECNIDSCDGRCLFQFVDDNGMYIGEDDLEYFNASIVLSNGGSRGGTKEDTQPHYLIYNANIQNCTLTLREGNKTLKDNEKRRFLKLDSWDETTFPMVHPAYYICSCDPTQPEDRSLWDCSSGTITSTVYPGLSVRVGLVAVGYYGLVKRAEFTYSSEINTKLGEHHNAVVNNKGCTELTLLETDIPGKNHTLKVNVSYTLYNTPFEINYKNILDLKFKIGIVQVSQNCPSGFQLSPSNNGTTCKCSQLLSIHDFQCAIAVKGLRPEITYKSSTNNYWMGYLGQQLVLSDHCPSHYCNTVNSTISTTGLTMEDINTTIQCNPDSNRQGLLCSQCSLGTSSQFGSIRCNQCTFAGLLLVPFGAVAGIGLILFLFLFNFTVLQGDIIGIAFYANVVGIMDEFLLKYSVRPLYIPLALINLGLGFETCFFDGMDEFSKAIVQFIFPFYLIALLIIIIIAAHKYNLKVFRIRFVARRSVPVLATIMLLTYSGLINVVIYGLQYTHIYNVDSGTYQVVWLHQPELEYFRGKHIAVGALCLVVTVFYLLPLMIVTLFGDLFRICSRNLWYSHFLDVLHGAFRYPFGFWFGIRLLFRIVCITLNIAINNTSVVAYTIFLTTASIILLQLLMEPFRTDNVIICRPDPERKITRRDLRKARISKIFRSQVIDSLFLFNLMFFTTAVAMSVSISSTYTTVGVCLSISLALAQLIAVTVHHTYHYFPLPDSTPQRMEEIRERFIGFRERMREKRRARRNRADTPVSTPVQIHYLSASMCFNSEEYSSSSSSSGEESDSERNRDDETRGETEDETREETTEM